MKIYQPILFVLSLMTLTNCTDDRNENSHNIAAEFYYFATIDGTKIVVEHEDSFKLLSTEGSSGGSNHCLRGYGAAILPNDNTPYLVITMESLLSYDQMCTKALDNDDFPTAFINQNYNYQYANGTTFSDPHIVIEYNDINRDYWASNIGEQVSNATFKIVESSLYTNPEYNETINMKVKCRFNCVLRNFDNEQILVEDGEAVFMFTSGI